MRRALVSLLSAVLLGLGCLTGARAADDGVKAILARAIKAHGGEEAMTRYKAAQSKNKGKIKLPGVGEIEFTQEVSLMMPDKFKEVVELEIANQKVKVITLVNGDKASIEANGKAVEINDNIKKMLKDAQYAMKVARLVALLTDKGFQLTPAGEIKVEGKPALGVCVSSKGQKDVNLFFSKDTGLLVKVESRSADPMTGKEFNEERIILEYREKGKEGVPLPKKVLIKHDGEMYLEAEVQETKLLETLDDSEFTK